MKPADPDDAEVETEFKRIEHERIAQERAEAREDIESSRPGPASRQPLQQWQLIALAVALAVGILAALLTNRRQPVVDPNAPPNPQERRLP